MPVQFDDVAPRNQRHPSAPLPESPATLAGLFENEIDARQALLQLRKGAVPPESVSIMIRANDCDNGDERQHEALARLIVATGIQPLADWLLGYASVIVPERGTFLVAGPLGAALAGDHVSDGTTAEHGAIAAVLERFGFSADEASYMQSRLSAGSLFASVTTSDANFQQLTMTAFSRESAVYIPRTDTDPHTVRSAARLLISPPEASTDGDLVVTDAVARFFRYCESGRARREYLDVQGRHIVDPDGRDVGAIVEFIAETILDSDGQEEHDEVRYAIVAFGGVLGIHRHHAAVPIDQFELVENPARVGIPRDVLRRAPAYNRVAPFSRREEREVCDYFGITPYWSDTG